MEGHFIVVEGLEGAGKSTALKTIKRFLSLHNIDFITTREPGGTIAGETIRHLLKDISTEPLDSRAELLLFYAARVQLIEQVIRPALLKGISVLGDRFELSTFAYQGGGRKLSLEVLQTLSAFCVLDLKPSLIIFLDIAPQEGLQRALGRGKLDRIELESQDFFYDVYQSYHEHIKTMDNVVVIDASKPLNIVQSAIRECLQHYLSRHATPTVN